MYNIKKPIALLVTLLAGLSCFSQSSQTLKVRRYVEDNQHAIVKEFVDLLAIPNVASDSVNIRRNAAFIMDMMKRRNISNIQLLEPNAGPPAVFGEVKAKNAKGTLTFYAHYDGQPVNPAEWAEGLSPFEPKLLTGALGSDEHNWPERSTSYRPEWRIYARGASDDKAGVVAILNAYDAIVRNNLPLNYNIKFFFEGEEEAGSPHLHQIFEKYGSLLASDLWIICDGPVHQTGKKIISFGVRGDAHVDVTVYGPKRPLHSGHYGNWAPNPAMMLAKLLSSMKDENGMVTIKDFYSDVTPLTNSELKAIQDMPAVDDQMKKELGLLRTEMTGKKLAEAIAMPSLNINGMQSANVGKMSSNVIPTIANAVLDLRLVVGNDWQRQQEKVVAHIRAQGYHVVDRDPTDEERARFPMLARVLKPQNGYNAQRTPLDLPVAGKVVAAVKSTTTDQVVLQPTSGGSLPLFLFEKYLNTRTLSVPIANHDNNQHAENENIRLANLWAGIETMVAVMSME